MTMTNVPTANTQTDLDHFLADFGQRSADRDPNWNPLAHELTFRHEVEIDNIEALLPEGVEVGLASGVKISFDPKAPGERRATDEECRQFRIDFPSLTFDIAGEDVATEIADKLQEFAAQMLQASIDIRYADLKYVEPDEDDGDSDGGGPGAT